MIKKRMLGILCGGLVLLTACGSQAPAPVALSDATDVPPVRNENFEQQFAEESLNEFKSIQIDVLAADIQVIAGEDWGVSYNLSEKEPLIRCGVEGDTLYVETEFDPKKYFERSDEWFVTVTVPAGSELDELELKTLSGNVNAEGFSCDTCQMSSVSGDLNAKSVDAGTIYIRSTSGDVTAQALSSVKVETETVSGETTVDGTLGELTADSVSGSIEVSGSVSEEASMETVSGKLSLSVNHPVAVAASSTSGTIDLNGTQTRGSVSTEGGIPITMKTVSGGIEIETA